ncbi:MAG: hypothetical protein KGL39_54825, partial [Patescibacteria group bacterium]|nr:hypothetical protein [Patescibacteria group bacterium]
MVGRCVKQIAFLFTLAGLSFVGLMQPAIGQVAVSPASFSTGLQWWAPNPTEQAGNASTTTFSFTALNTPIIAGTAFADLTASASLPSVLASDNGSGVLSGPGVSSGTVNYTTGAMSVTFAAAPPFNTNVYFGYKYIDGSGAVQTYQCGANLNANGKCYEPIVLTASGGSGITTSNPYHWTISDQDGHVLASLTASGGATYAPALLQNAFNQTGVLFGTLDCSGSATNTACSYSAPYAMPSGASVTIKATDGSTTGTSTGTFIFPSGIPEEWGIHRARSIEMNNEPYSIAWQASAAILPNSELPGTYIEFPYQSNEDVGFPATAGSEINRPAWSYDGKWFDYVITACGTFYFCPTSVHTVVSSNGGNPVDLGLVMPNGSEPGGTWDYFQPDWFVRGAGDGTNNDIYVEQLPTKTITQVASFADSTNGSLVSQMGGASLAMFKENNFGAGCAPTANCSVGGQGPRIFSYNLGPCEASLVASCATLAAQMNINLLLGDFGNTNGHAISEEYHLHDVYYQRGLSTIVYNYGPGGSAGESMFYLVPDNATSASQVNPFYPVVDPTINRSYWSHPAATANPNVVISGGLPFCNASSDPGNCTSSGSSGTIYWDMSHDTGHCTNTASFPPAPAGCGLINFDTTGVGHAAADGFDVSRVEHDNGGADLVNGVSTELMWDTLWNANHAIETTVYNWGPRPSQCGTCGNNGARSSYFYGPTQSPDATKVAEPQGETQSFIHGVPAPVKLLPWQFDLRTPDPPLLVSLASTSAAKVQWFPAALNHEAQQYWVWKQPACTGAWTRLAAVAASYSTNISASPSAYNYTDATLGSGTSACYGITTEDWTDAESGVMSAVIGVTNTSGVFSTTSHVPSGTVNFDSTAPDAVTAFTATPAKVCATNCASVDTPTMPIQINDQPHVSTTTTAAITVPGMQNVTVASATNIVAGLPLTIDTAGNAETVEVINISGSTITADFTKPHASGVAVTMGTLASGPWKVEVSYCKYTDFPLDTTCAETKPSVAGSVTVSANDGIQILSYNEMVGQDAVCVYMASPTDGTTFHKEGCRQIPDYASPNVVLGAGGGSGGQLSSRLWEVLSSHNESGVAPQSSNGTLGGYSLAWTNPSDTFLRRVLVLYSEGSAPSASNPWPFEIAALAPGTATYYDGYPNQTPSGHIFYAI